METVKTDNNKSPDQKEHTVTRRSFLKGAGVLGAAGAMAAISTVPGLSKATGTAYAGVKLGTKHDTMPVEISKDFKRFDTKNTSFCRGAWDPKLKPVLEQFFGKYHGHIPPTGEIGFTELDNALVVAGWSINNDAAADSQFGMPNSGLYAWEGQINPRKTDFASPEEASQKVKKAATFLGADLVGIADYDERWVYSNFYNPYTDESVPVQFPFEPKSVIVMAVEMDYDAFRTAPSLISSSAVGMGYSKMAEVAHRVATFVRQLGYRAIPCGNDTALSVPLAIQAGLGEQSRMGMVITEKYGPRVRLCKVFTELPLTPDKPITFGVEQFCEVCMKCADNCPSKAISRDPKTSFKTNNISNISGVKKWSFDAEKCFSFWAEIGGDCGNCIACCPYNKIDEWHHDMSKLATLTPAKPLLRYFDELFGYGRVYNKQAMTEWWKK